MLSRSVRGTARLLALVALLAGLSLVSAAPADAQRGRQRAAAPAQAAQPRAKPAARTARPPARGNLRRLGEGWFSKVWSYDNTGVVIKRIKPVIAGVEPVSIRQRAGLARRTVEASEVLREAGLPVPKAWLPEGHPGTIVMERVDGLMMNELSGDAKKRAFFATRKMFRDAERVAKNARGWYIDVNPDNVRYDARGAITGWIDPVVPWSGSRMRQIVNQREQAGIGAAE